MLAAFLGASDVGSLAHWVASQKPAIGMKEMRAAYWYRDETVLCRPVW